MFFSIFWINKVNKFHGFFLSFFFFFLFIYLFIFLFFCGIIFWVIFLSLFLVPVVFIFSGILYFFQVYFHYLHTFPICSIISIFHHFTQILCNIPFNISLSTISNFYHLLNYQLIFFCPSSIFINILFYIFLLHSFCHFSAFLSSSLHPSQRFSCIYSIEHQLRKTVLRHLIWSVFKWRKVWLIFHKHQKTIFEDTCFCLDVMKAVNEPSTCPAFLSSCLPASLPPSFLPACLPACFPPSPLPACLLPSFLPSFLPFFLPACFPPSLLPSCLPASLPPSLPPSFLPGFNFVLLEFFFFFNIN